MQFINGLTKKQRKEWGRKKMKERGLEYRKPKPLIYKGESIWEKIVEEKTKTI